MSELTIRLARAAFGCLALGVGLGALFALDRGLGAALRPLHAELNMWGWVTLLIYAMAYHMLPRFAGMPLRSPRAAEAQGWIAIAGVALAALGWIAAVWAPAVMLPLRLAGGLLQIGAAGLFVWLAAPTLRGRSGAA